MEVEYIGGKRSLVEALRSGRTLHKIWMLENVEKQLASTIVSEAKKAGVIVQRADKRKLDQLVQDVPHQGVVAQVAAYGYAELGEIIEKAKAAGEHAFILVLDEIEDPHNLGSILRSADCTGVHGVIIPKRRSVGLTATVAKTSAGAIEYVPVARVSNIAQTIDQLKDQGFWVIGADGTAEQLIYEVDVNMPIVLIIGNEHKGMGRLVKEKCDYLVKLPMLGHIDSLNASVAAGAIMYEVVRQRQSEING